MAQKRRRRTLRAVVLLSLVIMLMTTLSVCEILWSLGLDIDDDSARAESFSDDLQASKKLSPVDEERKLDVEGVTRIGKRAYTGSIKDKDAASALGTCVRPHNRMINGCSQ